MNLSSKEVDKALDLHRKSVILLMHDHRPLNEEIQRMLAGGVTGIVYKLSVDIEIHADIQASAQKYEGFARWALREMDGAYTDIERNNNAILALTAADIEAAKNMNKAAIILGNEGGKLLEGQLSLLRMFHRMGLREMQLTWAVPNQLCIRREGEMGLTDFGKDAVAEMNKLGMIIDVSHLTQQAFQDVLEISHDPFVISHGVAGMEQILGQHKAMAEKGGVLGVHFFYSYLRKEGKKHINLKDLLDKIDYCVENLGIDSVALGADFFPTTGSWVDLQHAQGTFNIEWAIRDVSKMLEVTEGLVTRGYSDGEIQKILGGNFLRVCKRVFGH